MLKCKFGQKLLHIVVVLPSEEKTGISKYHPHEAESKRVREPSGLTCLRCHWMPGPATPELGLHCQSLCAGNLAWNYLCMYLFPEFSQFSAVGL